MKVKEIIAFACSFIGEQEIVKKLTSTEAVSLTDKEQEKVDTLVRCFNLVNQEIASDYLPFLYTEEIDIDNSILNYADLDKTIINVYAVKGTFNRNVKYKAYTNYIQIFGKAKSITYSYLPDKSELDDDVEFFNGLSARNYAYGIASEYLLCDGLSEDAEIWEERFKESLFVLSRKRSELKLPARRWFWFFIKILKSIRRQPKKT